MSKGDFLGELDELVLLTTAVLHEEGRPIRLLLRSGQYDERKHVDHEGNTATMGVSGGGLTQERLPPVDCRR